MCKDKNCITILIVIIVIIIIIVTFIMTNLCRAGRRKTRKAGGELEWSRWEGGSGSARVQFSCFQNSFRHKKIFLYSWTGHLWLSPGTVATASVVCTCSLGEWEWSRWRWEAGSPSARAHFPRQNCPKKYKVFHFLFYEQGTWACHRGECPLHHYWTAWIQSLKTLKTWPSPNLKTLVWFRQWIGSMQFRKQKFSGTFRQSWQLAIIWNIFGQFKWQFLATIAIRHSGGRQE